MPRKAKKKDIVDSGPYHFPCPHSPCCKVFASQIPLPSDRYFSHLPTHLELAVNPPAVWATLQLEQLDMPAPTSQADKSRRSKLIAAARQHTEQLQLANNATLIICSNSEADARDNNLKHVHERRITRSVVAAERAGQMLKDDPFSFTQRQRLYPDATPEQSSALDSQFNSELLEEKAKKCQCQVRASSLHGRGLFTSVARAPHAEICAYEGMHIGEEEFKNVDCSDYVLEVRHTSPAQYIVGSFHSPASFANQNRDGTGNNCGLFRTQNGAVLRVLDNAIPANMELTVNYGDNFMFS